MSRRLVLLCVLPLILPLILAKSLPQTSETKEAPCSFESDSYSLTWTYDELSADVIFKLKAKSEHPNFWSGVYMGNDKPEDAIGVFARAGQVGIVDAHVTEDGIESDNVTNVQSLALDLEDGVLTAEFARPLTSSDSTDCDLAQCVTFFFPVVAPQIDVGGPIDIPTQMESKRVCDLAVNCKNEMAESLIKKRQDAPVCEYNSEDGESSVKWRKDGEKYVFTLAQPSKNGKWWSAIGVGQSMMDLDLVVSFTNNGKSNGVGAYKSENYAPPTKDDNAAPGVKKMSASNKNGVSKVEFSVGSEFIDNKVENGCVTLQIALLAGKYSKGKSIDKHESTPIAVPVCGIEMCGQTSEEALEENENESGDEEAAEEESTLEPMEEGSAQPEEEETNDKTEKTDQPEQPEIPEIPEQPESVEQNGNEEMTSSSKTPENVEAVETPLNEGEENMQGSGVPVEEVNAGISTSSVVPANENEAAQTSTTTGSAENIENVSSTTGSNGVIGNRPEESNVEGSGEFDTMTSPTSQGAEGEQKPSSTSTSGEISGDVAVPSRSSPVPEEVEGEIEVKNFSPLTNSENNGEVVESEASGEAPEENHEMISTSSAAPVGECDKDDLMVCGSYFDDYIGKVREWAVKHDHTLESQMWKACKLLREVKNVPTMCCHRFNQECANVKEPEL